MLEVMAVFTARAGKADALRKATLEIVEPTKAESGCLRFEVSESTEQPGAFFIRETWESEAALQAHFEQPYLKALVELHKDLLAEPLKLHKLKAY